MTKVERLRKIDTIYIRDLRGSVLRAMRYQIDVKFESPLGNGYWTPTDEILFTLNGSPLVPTNDPKVLELLSTGERFTVLPALPSHATDWDELKPNNG